MMASLRCTLAQHIGDAGPSGQCDNALQACGTVCYSKGCLCNGGTVTGTMYWKADFCTYDPSNELLTEAESNACESQAELCWGACYRTLCECDQGRTSISEEDCQEYATPAPAPKSCDDKEQECENGCYQQAAASGGQPASSGGTTTTKAVSQECLLGCEAAWYSCDAQQPTVEVNSARYHHVGAKADVMARPIHISLPHGSVTNAMPEPVPAWLYVLGALIAALLACIGSVLCFAICVRPLASQMGMAPGKDDFDEVNAVM